MLDRKEKLKALLKGSARIRYLEHIRADGAEFYAAVAAAGLEGVVAAKKEDAPYRAGRTSSWLKVKTPAFKAMEAKRLERGRR